VLRGACRAVKEQVSISTLKPLFPSPIPGHSGWGTEYLGHQGHTVLHGFTDSRWVRKLRHRPQEDYNGTQSPITVRTEWQDAW
jgi:hypothetical protein